MYVQPLSQFMRLWESLISLTPQTSGYTPTISLYLTNIEWEVGEGGWEGTLQRPPVAIFIAQARQKQGCRHGIAEWVTFSFPHARHASGTTIGCDDADDGCGRSFSESDSASGVSEGGCFRPNIDMSGMLDD